MQDRTISARLHKGSKNILLLGPRQVGKSTLVRSLKPKLIVNLADETLFLSYSKDPSRLRREISAIETASLIAIDEIQRVPALLNTVQAMLDDRSPHRFILTGSSARKLKRDGGNLLPGRVLLEYLDPLSIWELGSSLNLEKALQIGTLPGIYLDPESGAEILSSYTNIYLREEIQTEAAAKNIGTYARFLDIAAEASGDWINYSKLASDSEIPKETIRRFFGILEETLIAFRIPSYRPRQRNRRVSQRDRFLFFDIGVRNAVLEIHRHRLSPTETGKLFEHWILLQCLYFIRSFQKPWKLSSYRSDTGVEVDVILDLGARCLAIECKSGRTANEGQMKGLRSFEQIAEKPVDKYLVYQGDTRQKFSQGELAVPYREFLLDVLTSY